LGTPQHYKLEPPLDLALFQLVDEELIFGEELEQEKEIVKIISLWSYLSTPHENRDLRALIAN